MPAGFEPLVPNRSVSARIAEQILDRIDSGEFPVGTKLPSEMEFARLFGVSRPSVREALGALQFVGYVESARGSGSRVISTRRDAEALRALPAEVKVNGVLELFEARILLEPQIAALAAEHPVSTRAVEQAQSLVEGMRLVAHEPVLHAETDLRVHRAVAEICPNSLLRDAALQLLDIAASPALGAVRAQAWDNRVLPPIWGGQHSDVLSAIRQGDADAAATAAWAHLASSTLNALTVLGQDPEVDPTVIERVKVLATHGPAATGLSRDGNGNGNGNAGPTSTPTSSGCR